MNERQKKLALMPRQKKTSTYEMAATMVGLMFKDKEGELYDHCSESLDVMIQAETLTYLYVLQETNHPDAIFDVGTDQAVCLGEANKAGEVLCSLATWAFYYDVMDTLESE